MNFDVLSSILCMNTNSITPPMANFFLQNGKNPYDKTVEKNIRDQWIYTIGRGITIKPQVAGLCFFANITLVSSYLL